LICECSYQLVSETIPGANTSGINYGGMSPKYASLVSKKLLLVCMQLAYIKPIKNIVSIFFILIVLDCIFKF